MTTHYTLHFMISGTVLKKIRLLKGVNQKKMSEKLGISQPAYCKLEQSKYIQKEKLLPILEVLNYKQEDLVNIIYLIPPPQKSLIKIG
jgi:transcriptional regulator with XRE-family HTH domain